ncbi:alpha/beta hydrolase [Georgenia phoenicis]|uniref:alpha/beta fold hydrolase n=1 Tax=unclassified Georgenia TaxID=2626815 RepID=UPI0039B0C8C7
MSELVTARGDRVVYDRHGTGPGLVFVAGAGPHRATDPVTTATARAMPGVTTVVYDRLGRGESTADGAVGLDRELAALAALIDEVGGSAVLCGHSSGCSIALHATVAGLPVTGLALWEAPIAGDPAQILAWTDEFLRLLDAGELERARVHYMRDMPVEWLEAARSSPDWPEVVAQTGSLRADAESIAWAVSAPARDLLGGIDVPVLAMAGTETFEEMVDSSALLADAIPGAREVRVPGAFHTWEPEAMARTLSALVAAAAGIAMPGADGRG